MTEQPTAMLAGATVLRVVWVPGTDRLRGFCWCGATQEAEDPVALWEWLLEHPDSHGGTQAPTPVPA